MDLVLLVLASVASAITAGALPASSPVRDFGRHAAMEGRKVEDGSPYSMYPACRGGLEFAVPVGEAERAVGARVYHARVEAGKVKYYFCASCTVCADYGLATASPCAERADAACSADCLVPGCAFDDRSASCRLASAMGDDVTGEGGDGDSCGASVSAVGGEVERPLESVKKAPPELFQVPALKPLRGVEKPTSEPTDGSGWVASEALFVGTGIVAAVLIANVAAFAYIRSIKKRQQGQPRPITNSTEVLYAALAKARTDSNVTSHSHSHSRSGSVTTV